jgi:hypothetical protein
VNDPPVASADDAGLRSMTTVTQAAPGVLSNDSDVDGDGLTAVPRSRREPRQPDPERGRQLQLHSGSGIHRAGLVPVPRSDGTAASNTVTVSFLVVLSL